MADAKSKPAIPAWQRAQQSQPEEKPESTAQETPPASEAENAVTSAPDEGSSPDSLAETGTPDQLETIKSFLEDPAVKTASREKKRAFFESKGISKTLIDQVLHEDSLLQFSDFESFKQQSSQPRTTSTTPTPQQTSSAPPIITYPEFLVEAHKPPPLITLSRIWNTAQIASGIGALIYGASKYLVAPMTDNLNEARHDFAMHSQSKLDELNERISKVVSKQPEYKKDRQHGDGSELDDDGEGASETSDPTELYHRDVGTQTSPLPSRRPSTTPAGIAAEAQKKKDPTAYQVTGLSILSSHLNEMLERSEKLEGPMKERQEKMSNLRHYLDTLMYASPGISVWSTGEDLAKESGSGVKEDAVEELKKEIRGVKGLMLSAKRFPGVGAGRVGA